VGRLDPVVEAIKQGDKILAFDLLFEEQKRLKAKSDAIVAENRRAVEAWESLSAFMLKIQDDPTAWEKAREECGGGKGGGNWRRFS
jgi:hypothetical protein